MPNGIDNLPIQHPSGGLVPGVPPASQPGAGAPAPAGPEPGDTGLQQTLQRIREAMARQAQQREVAYRPIPPAVPGEEAYMQPRKDLTGAPGRGMQAFFHNMGAAVHNLGRAALQKRIQKAEADWETLVAAVQTNNQPLLDRLLSDNKALKNMARTFQMDWLQPQKQTPHSIALGNVLKKQGMKDQAKQMAFKNLLMKMLPVTQAPEDVKSLMEMARMQSQIARDQQTQAVNVARLIQHGQEVEAQQAETKRHNQSLENIDSLKTKIQEQKNLNDEQKARAQIKLDQQKTSETERHNHVMESIAGMKAKEDKKTSVQKSPAYQQYKDLQDQLGRLEQARAAAASKASWLSHPKLAQYEAQAAVLRSRMASVLKANPDLAKAIGETPEQAQEGQDPAVPGLKPRD